jgi:hypothetical protein
VLDLAEALRQSGRSWQKVVAERKAGIVRRPQERLPDADLAAGVLTFSDPFSEMRSLKLSVSLLDVLRALADHEAFSPTRVSWDSIRDAVQATSDSALKRRIERINEQVRKAGGGRMIDRTADGLSLDYALRCR